MNLSLKSNQKRTATQLNHFSHSFPIIFLLSAMHFSRSGSLLKIPPPFSYSLISQAREQELKSYQCFLARSYANVKTVKFFGEVKLEKSGISYKYFFQTLQRPQLTTCHIVLLVISYFSISPTRCSAYYKIMTFNAASITHCLAHINSTRDVNEYSRGIFPLSLRLQQFSLNSGYNSSSAQVVTNEDNH